MGGSGNAQEYFVAGGIAGVVSRTAIAPIERVKILYQVSRASVSTSWLQLAPRIWREEGFLSFWKGNTAAVTRVLPYMSLTFLSYEEYRAALKSCGLGKTGSTIAAGSAAGVTAVALTYPLDLVRATMATPGSTHTSMLGAMRSIVAHRGVLGLYSGMLATCLGVAPYAGIKFGSYEAIKGALGQVASVEEKDLVPWQRVTAGAIAGLIAQTVVYPLDVVRRRMQTHSGARALYDSPLHALRTIAREEGVLRGLYRGLALNWLKTAPNVAIYMSLYDTVKAHLLARAQGGADEHPCNRKATVV